MRSPDPAQAGASPEPDGFVLYLEGPGDRRILEAWCRRLRPRLAGRLSRISVILGGRQPARAAEHFRSLGGVGAGRRGLCVLDRDDGRPPDPQHQQEPGLDFFTWSRRHIESYLMVPAAIRRALPAGEADPRLERALREHLPDAGDEAAFRELDAKRILGPGGALSRALGRPLPLGRVARATRSSELHADVHAFFERVAREMGAIEPTVIR